MPLLVFQLDGRERRVEYEEGMSFLEVLRELCGVTSVKDGCAPEGFCGCCTILVDGSPTLSCRKDPSEITGREVTTLEGIPARLRRVLAESFIAEGAVQCGFCTPGLIVATHDLLQRNASPTDGEIREALAGNLCRCTGYEKILDAVRMAAARR